MPNKPIVGVRLDPKVLADLDNLAGAANLSRSEWLKYWLGGLSQLRREHSTRALADIPADRFKGFPGRPSGT